MSKVTTPITKQLNAEFGQRGFRCQVSVIGSFVSVRIEDAEGIISVKDACDVRNRARELLAKAGLIYPRDAEHRGQGPNYFMGGVVTTWLLYC